ncbi:LOW QUALITY PROTEIN: vasopressin V2 receptor-like, partial [Morus bassanus]
TPPPPTAPPSGTPWPPRDAALAAAEVGVLAVVLALALGGNALRPAPPLRRYLRHLSVADLGVAGGQVLPQLLWDVTDRFRGPDILCRVTKYLQGVAMFASAYVAVAMAYDRHRAICRPLGRCRRGVGIFGQREVGAGEKDCWATFIQPWGARAYVTWVALAVLVAPAALLGGLQVAVTRALGQQGQRGGLGRARAKSHRMAMVVLGVYVGCWAPFFCAQLWAVWDPQAPVEGPAFTILMLLASLNSCTNPWIYAAFSTSLSRAMGRILCPCRHPRGPPASPRAPHT